MGDIDGRSSRASAGQSAGGPHGVQQDGTERRFHEADFPSAHISVAAIRQRREYISSVNRSLACK